DQFASLNQGFAHWAQGQVARARAAFRAAVQACRREGDRYGEVLAASFLADLDVQEGRLRQAARRYQWAARSPRGSGRAGGQPAGDRPGDAMLRMESAGPCAA